MYIFSAVPTFNCATLHTHKSKASHLVVFNKLTILGSLFFVIKYDWAGIKGVTSVCISSILGPFKFLLCHGLPNPIISWSCSFEILTNREKELYNSSKSESIITSPSKIKIKSYSLLSS